MKRILFVDDNVKNLEEFNMTFCRYEGFEVDVAYGLKVGLIMLSQRPYNFVFLNEELSNNEYKGDFTGSEILEKKAIETNPNVITVEFVSGPHYGRRISPDKLLMKPFHYRTKDIEEILENA
jgi:DNA-binding response OmpR family regulator